MTNEARSTPFLNPGGGTVSALVHEPRVSLAVLESMLAPFASSGRLMVLLRHKPVGAEVERDLVRSISIRAIEAAVDRVVEAGCFLDATEQGDLLPLTRTEFVTGAESQSKTGEPHAPERANPANIQAFTFCFAVDYLAGENHVIDKPEEYGFWRGYVPKMTPPWPDRLLSWVITDPVSLRARHAAFYPTGARGGALNLWVYWRIGKATNFIEGSYASDISLINWPQNDY